MSEVLSRRPQRDTAARHFAIVASLFNAEYVEGLLHHASKEFRSLTPNAELSIHRVPGAFEIPVTVRELAIHQKHDAVLALGVIIKCHTSHANNLARSVTDALQRVAIDTGIPVINAVLSVENEAQARERCLEGKINRGTEAARAAVQIAGVMEELRAT
ncbi:MAG: 6,7-dimethyl-8-ribityllumazine synthase [Chthoniobacterales bacterium]